MTEAITALATLEDGGALTKKGLHLPENITPERYEAVGRLLTEAEDALQWAWGDYFLFGEDVFPEEHSQLWESARIDHHRSMQYIRIAKAIPEHARRDLSWSHHRVVYTLDAEARDHWLLLAENEGWTRDELAEAVKAARGEANGAGGMPAPSRTYVLERVSDAAERVWQAASRDGECYIVPAEEFEVLAAALGVEL